MFKALREIQELGLAEGVCYYAMRMLKHRTRVMVAMDSLIVPGLDSEPSPEEQALAWGLIQEIEAREGMSIGDLPQWRAEAYSHEIYDIVDRKRDQAPPPPPEVTERAKQFLEEMRRTPINGAKPARPTRQKT